MRYAVGLCLVAAVGLLEAAQQPLQPLPDQETFLAEVRARLQTDGQRQYWYGYVETRRRTEVDGDGNVKSEAVKVVESSPGLSGEPRWDLVVMEDGEPVSEAELEKQRLERAKQVQETVGRLARQTEADREAQEREWAKQRRELADTMDDIFRVYDIEMLSREVIAGHTAIQLSLTPRPEATVLSKDGRWFRHFRGRVWISESEYELVRLEVEAIDDVNVGLGLLARVHKGTTASVERRKVDEAWLPIYFGYTVSARVMLLRRVRETISSEFSNYRKHSPELSTR